MKIQFNVFNTKEIEPIIKVTVNLRIKNELEANILKTLSKNKYEKLFNEIKQYFKNNEDILEILRYYDQYMQNYDLIEKFKKEMKNNNKVLKIDDRKLLSLIKLCINKYTMPNIKTLNKDENEDNDTYIYKLETEFF